VARGSQRTEHTTQFVQSVISGIFEGGTSGMMTGMRIGLRRDSISACIESFSPHLYISIFNVYDHTYR
jgi:hypothetical protein